MLQAALHAGALSVMASGNVLPVIDLLQVSFGETFCNERVTQSTVRTVDRHQCLRACGKCIWADAFSTYG